jgi:hypothetical protein
MRNEIHLSKAQASVITKLQSGEILHYIDGIKPSCFFHQNIKLISWATIFKLEQLKLIVRKYRKVELTDSGRDLKIN